MTKAWATSDPESPLSILSQTTINNHNDAGDNNFVDVPAASIPGLVTFPIVLINGTESSKFTYDLILWHRPFETGDTTEGDWTEGEAMAGELGTWAQRSGGSNGYYYELSSGDAAGALSFQYSTRMNSTYFGAMTPIISAKATGDAKRVIRQN